MSLKSKLGRISKRARKERGHESTELVAPAEQGASGPEGETVSNSESEATPLSLEHAMDQCVPEPLTAPLAVQEAAGKVSGEAAREADITRDMSSPEPESLEIKTQGKTFVFHSKPLPSALKSGATTPTATKHTSFIERPHSRPHSRNGSRVGLQRSSSYAQVARDKKNLSTNDTRQFYSQAMTPTTETRPSLSRKSSYADDRRAMEYLSSQQGNTEGSNLIFRTSSRIWDANKESGWFAYDAGSRISSGRPSRRTSVAGSFDNEDEDDDESDSDKEFHPGWFISRTQSYQDLSEDDDEPEFADSYLIRAADWILGIPHDSPMTLRNSLKRKPQKLSLAEKRNYREANVTEDPAFLIGAYLSIKEMMS